MKRLILMVQFLTRIPIKKNLDVTTEDFHKGVIYFPVIGFIIGGCILGLYTISSRFFNALTLSAIIVFGEILLTGGLHLDGLADSSDGLFSNRKKNQILEIMKDSRVGSNGALAMIVIIIFKIILLTNLSVNELKWVIVLMPVYSRLMVVYSAYKFPYARDKGMGGLFIGNTTFNQLIISLLFVVMVSIFNLKALVVLFFLFLIIHLIAKKVSLLIDGITGDILGFIVEVSEVIFIILYLIII